jgi:hypothetical protein
MSQDPVSGVTDVTDRSPSADLLSVLSVTHLGCFDKLSGGAEDAPACAKGWQGGNRQNRQKPLTPGHGAAP